MYHNIKVDLIYYNTPADYEMEFNLGGCCRMRLLSDKPADPKEFLKSLARAVERSKVILAVGALFGEDGLLAVISHAISRSLVPTDCSEYGLKSEGPISLIDGSAPLVNEDGMLAGCILESGPQTMILLSENKTVRKSVMAPLVHPYIKELSGTDSDEAPSLFAPVNPAEETEAELPTAEPDGPVPAEEEYTLETILPEEETALEEPDTESDPVPTENREAEMVVEEIEFPEDEPQEISEETPEETEEPAEEAFETVPEVVSEVIPEDEPEEETEKKEPAKKPAEDEPDSDESKESFILDVDESSSGYEEVTEEDPDFYLETEQEGKKKRRELIQDSIDLVSMDVESDYHYEEPDDAFHPGAKFRLPVLFLFAALLIILALLVFLVIFLPLRSGISPVRYLQEIFSQLSGRP